MNKIVSKPKLGLFGTITIPSDKSISHRAVLFSLLTNGTSVIKNFSYGQDPQTSLDICKQLGAQYEFKNDLLFISSNSKLVPPTCNINCKNSGTTMRLLSGILSAQNFTSILTGDDSLSSRSMKNVIQPLELMGAKINSNKFKAPLTISGQNLHPIDYVSNSSSAQVKSAVILAGLLTSGGNTIYKEKFLSRNHTELMLSYMDADITSQENNCTTIIKKSKLSPKTIEIPGDISSAAYIIAAATIVENSQIIIKNVGLNPTRTGIIDTLKLMGANIEILDLKTISNELVGDIKITYSQLKGCEICAEMIPRLIDEIPLIAVLATQAEGVTTIKNASDLRNKESDRIKCIVTELKKLNANIEETADGMIIRSKTNLKGGICLNSYKDHRIAMSLYIAGLICKENVMINDFEWVNISFPEFERIMSNIYKS